MSRPVRDRGERGFALLVVFLMAAAVALMLYQQMPRVAFESEREKEQLLIDRGEQYKRAIQLYYVAFKRYPSKIEDLESTNDKRFLRRRYKDPYTGKDEWRLVHTNGAFLTDSLVQKPPANPADQKNQTTTAGGTTAPGGTAGAATPPSGNATDPNAPPVVNPAVAARPSDRPLVQPNTFAGNTFPGNAPGGQAPPDFNQGFNPPNRGDAAAAFPPLTLYPNGYNGSSGQPGQPGQAGQPGNLQQGLNQGMLINPGLTQPGATQPGFPQPGNIQAGFGQPGVFPPGFPQGAVPPGGQGPSFPPGAVSPGVTPGVFNPNQLNPNQTPFPGQQVQGPLPGQQIQPQVPNVNPIFPNQVPPVSQPPANQAPQQYSVDANGLPVPNPAFRQNPNGQNAPGANLPPGTTPGSQNQAVNLINQLLTTPRQPPPGLGTNTQTVGGGIAGIASTYSGATIKSYGDRTKFEEWEFVFQPQQQQGVPGQAAPGQPGQPGTNPQQPGQGGGTPGLPGMPPGLPGMPPGLPGMPPATPAPRP